MHITSILEKIRGRSRGRVQECEPPPEMTCGFLIELVFTSGHQSVMPFLSGALPPKKNPGSAPENCSRVLAKHLCAMHVQI